MNYAPRRSTNLSIDAALLNEARELGLNLSRSSENGIRASVKAERERRWLEENLPAIEAWNRWIAENPMPGESIRAWR
jgi:antitoxin CcdA